MGHNKEGVLGLAVLAIALALYKTVHIANIAVLNPQGIVAAKEKSLMITATLLMLIIVIPVLVLTYAIAWKYRAGNKKAKYSPDWDHNLAAETIWWLFPLLIIGIISVISWNASHQLDPFRPLSGTTAPLNVQVVAMQWKWLFIYPKQHIASLNYLEFPAATPINFQITSDAPMNSFWIPSLGGQVYAMSGMSTELHLMSNNPGTYQGVSANISGSGFSGMHFVAQASSSHNFNAWVKGAQKTSDSLSWSSYQSLAQPSQNVQPYIYKLANTDLYARVIEKYAATGIQAGMHMGDH